jgi:hypothetical protein
MGVIRRYKVVEIAMAKEERVFGDGGLLLCREGIKAV